MSRRKNRGARPPALARWVALGLVALLGLGGLSFYFSGDGREANRGVDQFIDLHGLAVDPHQPDIVWLATHEGLLRSDQSGDGAWTYAGKTRPDLMGFTVSPVKPGVMYSSGHPGKGVNLPNPMGFIVSRDYGDTWQAVSLAGQADFHTMAASAADPELVYGWFGELYRSDDEGATWERFRPAALTGEGREPFQFAAHPTDPNTVLAATRQGLLRSNDRGETWETILAEPVSAVTFTPGAGEQRGEHLIIYQAGPGLMRSQDGGQTWESLDFVAGNRADAASYIAVHPTDARIIYVGTFGADLVRTRDGGTTWEVLAEEGKVVAN